MQARQAAAHRIQSLFAECFFDARKHLVFFEAYVIVKKLSDARQLVLSNCPLCRDPLLEIEDGGANLGVIGEEPHHVSVFVDPRVARIGGEQHFFLFAKMRPPRLVPETHKFLRLPSHRRGALLQRRFRRAPHLQRLNQRKVMVLAERMQTWMAFQRVTVF